MAYDGLTMAAVCMELQQLIGARIDKIYQPQKELILIHLRQRNGGRLRLLICAEASTPRIHLTDYPFTNPSTPPMFCMLLRKYLEGGKIISVTQKGVDRILVFTIETYNEFRELCQRQLICEVMGKHSNIILINPDNGFIIDGIKRYSHAVSRHREVRPGSPYVGPPSQDKKDPRYLPYEEMEQGLLDQLGRKVASALVNLLDGISPLLGKELVSRANLSQETKVDHCGAYEFQRLFTALQELRHELVSGCPTPTLVKKENGFQAFSAFRLSQFPQEILVHPSSVNESIDIYFQVQKEQQLFLRRQQKLAHIIRKELDRCFKKASLQENTVSLAAEADTFRIKGEILTANLFRIQLGDKLATLKNFYDPNGKTIRIELVPELSPADNAQRYFRLYKKAKSTADKASIYYQKTRDEIFYLEAVQHDLERVEAIAELEEIAQELAGQGYLKTVLSKESRQKPTSKKPELLSFRSSDGYSLLVGKNNRQNDYLTLKVAKDQDLWLHTKDLPGAHVIVKNPEGKPVPRQTLLEAATLAAYYSKGRLSSKVPVDYTEKKNVRKPSGAKPGMVIYEHYQTLYITPNDELIERLRQDHQ